MALRQAFDEEGTPPTGLMGFGISISRSRGRLLMVGQTPVSAWGAAHCDVLAVPVLALGAVGVVSTLVPVLAARKCSMGPVKRIAALARGLQRIGLWLAFPLLGHCLAGPYSDVTAGNSRPRSITMITEAFSVGSHVLKAFPANSGRYSACRHWSYSSWPWRPSGTCAASLTTQAADSIDADLCRHGCSASGLRLSRSAPPTS